MTLNMEFSFDEKNYRHYMNGFLSVLHCHHYLCLTTKMAGDYESLGGIRILQEVAEDSMRPLFDDYIQKNGITAIGDKFVVGTEYYSVLGLGKMKMSLNDKGGMVRLLRSHIDQGWKKKWGQHDAHINHFTCGYIAAMFAAATDRPPRSYTVTEIESIVTGKESSLFQVRPN